MKSILRIILLNLAFLFFLLPMVSMAMEDAVPLDIAGDSALVTRLDGTAMVMAKGTSNKIALGAGATLRPGDTVTTGTDSRIELKLPDSSYIRFDEETTFILTSLTVDEKAQKRDVNIDVVIGKTWANVSKYMGDRGGFTISTKTAVAGVRGTIYRVNANQDASSTIKVYWGEVIVQNRILTPVYDASGRLSQPVPVSGPHPIPGPHPVGMEEWTFIVRTMNVIQVDKDGKAQPPSPFSAEDDRDAWVVWNQERDKSIVN